MSGHYLLYLFGAIIISSFSPPFIVGSNDGSGSGILNVSYGMKVYDINCTTNCTTPPFTFSEIAKKESFSENLNVIINVYEETVLLDEDVKFQNLTSVSVHGNGNSIVCSRNTGIIFLRLESVTLDRIAIEHCGTITYFQSGLQILLCGHVTLINMTLVNNNGSGVNINSPQHSLTVMESYFIRNKLLVNSERTIEGGNGLRLNIHNSINVTVVIKNSMFADNTDNGREYGYLYGHLKGRGRGGGMFINVEKSSEILINITNCTFEKNTAHLGSGLSVSLRGNGSVDNTVYISNSVFNRNGCNHLNSKNLGIGGGALLSFENIKSYEKNLNKLIFTNITFEKNRAELGGAVFFFSNKYDSRTTGKLLFDNCTWIGNTAHIGSAVLLTPNIFVRAVVGHLPQPNFSNCQFKQNTIYSHSRPGKEFGSGTIYSSLFSLTFTNNVDFIDNIGSGITIINGEANFIKSSANFLNNVAVQGGALSLIGVSAMIIGKHKEYLFENNQAYYRGGAIYAELVDSADIMTSRSCFIRYEKKVQIPIHSKFWDSHLVFKNNSAKREGHSIFATSFLPCQVVGSKDRQYKLLNVSEIFQEPGVMIQNKTIPKQISSEGTGINITKNPLRASPGLQQELNITIFDDFGQDVNMDVAVYEEPNSNLTVTAIFSNGSQHYVKLNGHEGNVGNLTLQTLGTIQLRSKLDVRLLNCPPGYKLVDLSCICDFESYTGIIKCQDNVAYLIKGFWAANIMIEGNRSILATAICPVGFCQYINSNVEGMTVRLPSDSNQLEEIMCGESRRGILCGTCNEGYTAYYHSPKLSCMKEEPFSCKLGWIFYILSEIVPVTFLFGLVLAFNINLTSGSLNGFILFSQLQRTLYIDASGIITYDPVIQYLTMVYQVIYGFFNLDFFNIEPLSYCLWKNSSVLDMLCFKYFTITYSFFLVLSVILFMRYCAARCLGRYYSISALRNSIIHGISGFLVLCYSQTITVSFFIIYSQPLSVSLREKAKISKLTRVWYSGDYESFGTGHLPYAVPALVVILTVGCVPPILLLCYPQINKTLTHFKLNKVWGLRKLEHLHTFKPLFDSFQGSFKDKYRFFAGLYFFYRWIGLLVYTYSSSFSNFYITIQLLVLLMLVVHSICQPYQKWQHNVLDTFIFGIILATNAITILNYYSVRVDLTRHTGGILLSAFQLLFIYLPILYLVCYIVAWIFRETAWSKRHPEVPEEFSLIKIGKKAENSNKSQSNDEENDLPYRLLGHAEDVSFIESVKDAASVEINTY